MLSFFNSNMSTRGLTSSDPDLKFVLWLSYKITQKLALNMLQPCA